MGNRMTAIVESVTGTIRHTGVRRILTHLTWSLTTTVIGFLTALVMTAIGVRPERHAECIVYDMGRRFGRRVLGGGAFCNGNVIVISSLVPRGKSMTRLLDHERGHYLQSLVMGPFHFPVVSTSSLIHAIWWRIRKPKKGSYYDFWTEKWADRLGGVER